MPDKRRFITSKYVLVAKLLVSWNLFYLKCALESPKTESLSGERCTNWYEIALKQLHIAILLSDSVSIVKLDHSLP